LSFTNKANPKDNKTLSFLEIKDSNQNAVWDCAKGNSKGGNSNFLLNKVQFEFPSVFHDLLAFTGLQGAYLCYLWDT
jgi:hypothetical protein